MVVEARRRPSEQQLAEAGLRSAAAPSAALFRDTVGQFDKVIDLERNLLRKSILKLEHDITETETHMSIQEEELMLWQDRLQRIQQDNEMKLRLAKVRVDGTRYRHKSEGRHGASVRRASPLGLIAEGNEDSGDERVEGEEEEDEGGYVAERTASHPLATVKSINSLASMVVGELTVLRAQWQELVAASNTIASVQHLQLHVSEQTGGKETEAVRGSAPQDAQRPPPGPGPAAQATGAGPAGTQAASLGQRPPAAAAGPAAARGGGAVPFSHGPVQQGGPQLGTRGGAAMPWQYSARPGGAPSPVAGGARAVPTWAALQQPASHRPAATRTSHQHPCC